MQLTADSATQTELNAAISTITPAGLNLKEGITGTLLDKVIEFRNIEDSRNGINLDQMGRQWKESALWAIAQNKRYTSRLLVSAGRFKLGTEALDDMTRWGKPTNISRNKCSLKNKQNGSQWQDNVISYCERTTKFGDSKDLSSFVHLAQIKGQTKQPKTRT